MIPRLLHTRIDKILRSGDKKKIVLLFGPRQVGKTTLLQTIAREYEQTRRQSHLWLNADEPDIRAILTDASSTALKRLCAPHTMVVIDEAQRVPNIGLTLKLMADTMPDVQVIATGSSAFDLAGQVQEPLTGRKREFYLFPLSFGEMVGYHGLLEEKRLLEYRLLYGYYPEVVQSPGEERAAVRSLAESYLFKDVLALGAIHKPDRLEKLVRALALQIGSEVSYNELGQITGMNNETVERYITVLEQAFVVFRLGAFARNLRNELKKSRKVYFYDLGVRNAVINNFAPLDSRTDVGAMWENFLIAERMKTLSYHGVVKNRTFWRTHAQQELDYVEEADGRFQAFEFKWNPKAKVRIPKAFLDAYPEATVSVVSRENWENFLMPDSL
jgi:predicted AAA+ superfamily ATPase